MEKAGHNVYAMTRRPKHYDGAGSPIFGDVSDQHSLRTARRNAETAYYFVHSLGKSDFIERDAEAVKASACGAADKNLERVIYLGRLAITPMTCRRTYAAGERSSTCSRQPAYQ
ncbi:hypothetical protein GCM10009765_22220 [Fodinicola feengrottensis]|uniref:Uncharacterized protein n=1 Tax=Fodinicola feengrottensis TaxID=435914 RepID=A0ABP4SG25_9ACTN